MSSRLVLDCTWKQGKKVALSVLLACCFSWGQTGTPSTGPDESGKFVLYKFAQPIGAESYTITRQDQAIVLTSQFDFKDRGNAVPLKTSLRAAIDYSPQSFTVAGKNCRFCPIDSGVEIGNGTAQVRQGKEMHRAEVPEKFFTMAGYAPVAMQMAMMRYWRSHGSPAALPMLPSGEIRIQDRGPESFDLDGRKVTL